jgi:integrase
MMKVANRCERLAANTVKPVVKELFTMSKSYSTRAPVRSKPANNAGPLTPDTTGNPGHLTPDATPAPGIAGKPSKPYPDFPLFAHATGRWAKKIRGRFVYFGPWSDPDGALAKYLEQKDALHAGKEPRPAPDALTVKALANAFLNHKLALVDSGELSPLTLGKYKQVAALVVTQFGKQRIVADIGPDDFARLRNKMAKRWGSLRVRDFIQHIRSIFKHGFDTGMMTTPMRFGPGFARPSKKTMRLERAKRGIRMFEAAELRRIIAAAGQPLKAMIYLGVNAGFGNADCGTLPLCALDLEGGWVNYHRPKTGIDRRCALWPETVDAIREALARRPKPKDSADAGLVFITKYGLPWAKDIENSVVSKEMRKVLDTLGINGHRNFYGLRRTFETIGGETKDQVAVDAIMGHADESMAAVYRQRIGDDRLQAVANHVRAWLFAPA